MHELESNLKRTSVCMCVSVCVFTYNNRYTLNNSILMYPKT